MTTKGTTVFQEVLDAVDTLPVQQQEDILQIMQKRMVEKKREALANAVREATVEYDSGKVRKGTAGECMKDLAQEIVATIADAIRPKKIFLFGSRANGRATPDSDIDLLLLCDVGRDKHRIRVRALKLFGHPQFSLDVFVLTPEEFEAQKHVANTLAREVSETGVLCYG